MMYCHIFFGSKKNFSWQQVLCHKYKYKYKYEAQQICHIVLSSRTPVTGLILWG